MMTFTTESGRYLVKSHGNGWAYEITDQESSETIFLQDNEAQILQDHCSNFDDEIALSDYFGLEE